MAQFTIYSSTDASAPTLTGQTGKLGDLLKACLVDGYGAKSAAGWSCPVAESGDIFSFKNGTGSSEMSFVLNDAGPNATSTYKEAWATGWESVAGVGSPVGSGSGQFPTASQLLTSGHVVWRKSAAADATARQWIVAADAHTCYLFLATGDYTGGNVYFPAMFGDIYSVKTGSEDAYRALLIGRTAENSNSGAVSSATFNSCIESFTSVFGFGAVYGAFFYGSPGHYMPRSVGGGGSSTLVQKSSDVGSLRHISTPQSNQYNPFSACGRAGVNLADNSIEISPFVIYEGTSRRGRLRGLYMINSYYSYFPDGYTFSGTGDFAGKTFMVVSGVLNESALAIETSDTLETN